MVTITSNNNNEVPSLSVIRIPANFRCDWGDAVFTKPPRFLYATLPDRKILVIINVANGSISQVRALRNLDVNELIIG